MPNIEVETHKVAAPDVVIPTVDTVRHEVLLYTWLAEHKPLVLCGPPGSGKTMTLFCSLRSLPDMEVSEIICYEIKCIFVKLISLNSSKPVLFCQHSALSELTVKHLFYTGEILQKLLVTT